MVMGLNPAAGEGIFFMKCQLLNTTLKLMPAFFGKKDNEITSYLFQGAVDLWSLESHFALKLIAAIQSHVASAAQASVQVRAGFFELKPNFFFAELSKQCGLFNVLRFATVAS